MILAAIVVLFVVVALLSGRQPERDAVAAAERELGIDLDARRIETNGVELHVVQAGPANGEPVVLLHGFPEFWWAWKGQVGLLAEAGFRVIVPDQRGYGLSEKPDGIEPYRVEELGLDVVGLIQALGYEDAYLAGHDWGGRVAWQVAIQHQEVVRKLVIFQLPHPLARAEVTEETVSWYRSFFQLPFLPELVVRLGNWAALAGALRDTSLPGAFTDADLAQYRAAWDQPGAARAMVNWYRAGFRYPPEFEGERRVRVPTNVVLAPDDAFIPESLTRASLEHCDDGVLTELESGTHWVLHEAPERTSRILIDFFSN